MRTSSAIEALPGWGHPTRKGAVDKGTYQVPPDAYGKNLELLVGRLKKTGAKLIWCSTTPVPEGSGSRVAGDAVKYNAVAAEIMKRHSISVNDLHAFAQPRLKDIQRSANVHFTREGSRTLAGEVVKHLRTALSR